MATPSRRDTSDASPTPPEPHRRARFYSTKTFRFLVMLSLTASFFFVELVVGNMTNSLALVADAFHMLSDVIALIIGLLAIRIAKRRSNINTYGWVRAEVVGANINTVFLLALCLTIVFDTIKRFIQPEPIVNVNLLLIVGSAGLGMNIVGLFLFQGFHGHTHGGGAHGHSHSATGGSKSTDTPRTTSMEIEENATGVQKQHTTITMSSHDIEPVETIVGSSKMKRHSLRALDEV
jgi:solute carrier family 30 (zinc transporter), member 1